MANPILGHIQCPICKQPNATVHEQNKGKAKRKKYIRCYKPNGGGCGTAQVTGPDAQQWIEDNWRPLDEPAPDGLADPVEPTPEADQGKPDDKEPEQKKRSLLSRILVADDDEESAA